MRRLFFPLALLLAACSYTLTVDLSSMTLNLSGLPSTSPFPGDAYVVFPKDPQTFNPPPVDVVRGCGSRAGPWPTSPWTRPSRCTEGSRTRARTWGAIP